jgi:hypothetical protein
MTYSPNDPITFLFGACLPVGRGFGAYPKQLARIIGTSLVRF